MPSFKFVGDVPRVFPGDGSKPAVQVQLEDGEVRVGLVEPGDVVEAEENPDPAFFEEVPAKTVKPQTTKEA